MMDLCEWEVSLVLHVHSVLGQLKATHSRSKKKAKISDNLTLHFKAKKSH